MHHSLRALALGSLLLTAACESQPTRSGTAGDADAQGNVAASESTAQANAAAGAELPIADAQDFEDAQRGLIESEPDLEIRDASGKVLRRPKDFAFVSGEAPPSVHPSLWRQAKLNGIHGLFEVAEGIYQVRGYDVSNMTLIRGERGWIIVDPLTARETATAAISLARKHLGNDPVSAVIFTHSHMDHFGGIGAILPDPAHRATVPIIAPKGFLEEATSENIFAGSAMGRRASFMYGWALDSSARGHVDSGLGTTPVRAGFGILPPTEIIDHTAQEKTLDGVRFVFQYAPHTEAPAELAFYLPDRKAYCGAEIVSRTMHNLYTLRGAKVRDALLWSGAIDDAIERFGDAELVFNSHGWPTWGNEQVLDYLAKQRDVYKFIHDQTLRLANSGATPNEIAEELVMPEALRTTFHVRGYYGTLRHNAKAVYQHYLGWYDGNPAHLDPHPPAAEAKRYVAAMGGGTEVLKLGQEAYASGDYRWAATVLNHLVFAEPENTKAREALAQAYDQLGYRAESGPWRDVYLSGAFELRHSIQANGLSAASAKGLLDHLPPEQFFAAMATRLNAPEAEGMRLVLNFVFTDLEETYVLTLQNSVLHHRRRPQPDPQANATVRLTRAFLVDMATGNVGLRDALFSEDLSVEGSRIDLLSFFRLLDEHQPYFPIVTP